VDHRLVRERYIEAITHPAAALYLFLVTVADCQGLSFYSDASVMSRLSMDALTLHEARRDLVTSGLIVFESPLYQVLSLDPLPDTPAKAPLDRPVAIGQLFKQMMGGAQ
jgi:hypothetical protein